VKVGAEPRKVGVLAVLLAVAAYLIYTNMFTEEVRPRGAARRMTPAEGSPGPVSAERASSVPVARPRAVRAGIQEFRPTVKPKRAEDRPDPMTIDPTLRLDLLARLQDVDLGAGLRSLFEFSQPPAPKAPEPKIIPKPAGDNNDPPKEPAKQQAEAPAKPPPPTITLKFYGYVSPVRAGAKRAFFLDGEEIFVASEGELIRKRYKVVRIGVNSVVVEDTEHKHQQTLRLEEQVG